MPKFSANISLMFNEVDFLDRFAAARNAGFAAVEFLFPYAYDAEQISRRMNENALELSVFNFPAGNWDAGERGYAAIPARKDEFRASIGLALEHAKATKAQRLHAMAGVTTGMDQSLARATYVQNLAHTAQTLADHGLELLIEPLNARDMPGYFLHNTEQAAQIIADVDVPNLKLQFDIYHHQIIRGDVMRSLEQYMPIIGHIQIASVPERHEPDQGELNYRAVLEHIDQLGYKGWIGCEYRPRGDTVAGLGWMSK